MTEENQVIYIDDKPFDVSKFSPEQKYFMRQINDLVAKIQGHHFQLDQLEVAKKAYSTALIDSLKEEVDGEAA